MNWRRLFRTDLRALLLGRPSLEQPLPLIRVLHIPLPSLPLGRVRRRRNWNNLQLITEQLLVMIQANMPVDRGLNAASRDARDYRLHAALTGLGMDVARGLTLSESMRNQPKVFPEFYVDLVQVGERTGTLAESFEMLREILIESSIMRREVASFLGYLGMVWLVLVVIALGIANYILPQFGDIMKDFGRPIPNSARWMIEWGYSIGDPLRYCFDTGKNFNFGLFLVKFAVLVLVLSAAASALLWLVTAPMRWVTRRKRTGARAIGLFCLRVPLVHSLFVKRSMAHVATILQRLVEARVPLDSALETCAGVGVNPVFARALRRAAERVRAGDTLKTALERESSLPESFVGFASLGESSGLLPEALERVAALYRRQVIKAQRILIDVLTPVGVGIAGCFVLALMSTVFRMLTTIADGIALNTW